MSETNDQSLLQKLLTDPHTTAEYLDIIKSIAAEENTEQALHHFIAKHDHNCTPTKLFHALTSMKDRDISYWIGSYNSSIIQNDELKRSKGPLLMIDGDKSVTFHGHEIRNFAYSYGTLKWDAADGNPCAAELAFNLVTGMGHQLPPDSAYIGNEVTGKITYPGKEAQVFFARFGSDDASDQSEDVRARVFGAATTMIGARIMAGSKHSIKRAWIGMQKIRSGFLDTSRNLEDGIPNIGMVQGQEYDPDYRSTDVQDRKLDFPVTVVMVTNSTVLAVYTLSDKTIKRQNP